MFPLFAFVDAPPQNATPEVNYLFYYLQFVYGGQGRSEGGGGRGYWNAKRVLV